MDRENFNAIITRYLDKFDDTNKNPNREYFKWNAIDCFQKNWDLNAEDMLRMFSASVREFSVLLDTGKAAPTSGIKELLKNPEEVEFVRSAFRDLYAGDSGDLNLRQKRLENFVDTINQRILHYWPDSFLYPQTMRSAMCYLTALNPRDNYLFFWSRAHNWANCVEFDQDIGSGSSFSLPMYYQMCDEIVAEIGKNTELRRCADKRAEAAGVTIEDNYHTLAYDIIFCATAYNLYVDIPHYPKGTSLRIQRAKDRAQLEQAKSEYVAAKMAYEKCVQEHPPEINLVGRAVRHKVFGVGTVFDQTKDRQQVNFDAGIKTFVYPSAYIQKFLTPVSEEDKNALDEALAYDSTYSACKEELSVKEKEYFAMKAVFEKKWIKSDTAEPIAED